MRRYDEPVEVHRGLVDRVEGPEQFRWRGRRWQVRAVVGCFVETAPWWEHRAVRGLLGTHPDDHPVDPGELAGPVSVATLVVEREVWRVDASRELDASRDREVRGVFDLVHDTGTGRWRLTGCQD